MGARWSRWEAKPLPNPTRLFESAATIGSTAPPSTFVNETIAVLNAIRSAAPLAGTIIGINLANGLSVLGALTVLFGFFKAQVDDVAKKLRQYVDAELLAGVLTIIRVNWGKSE